MQSSTDQHHTTIGENGFIWYCGMVEDIETDPLQIGRIKVRAYNIHNPNKSLVPTDSLPWAHISQSPISAASKLIGIAPLGIQIGSLVWGFFLDGNHYQQMVVCGTFQGIPSGTSDLTKLATGTNTLPNAGDPLEPKSPYAAKYPHNKVTTTTSGHVIEIDDTPGHERLRYWHKAGSYDETGPDGTRVTKTVKDYYLIIHENGTVYVGGDLKVVVKGNANIEIDGNLDTQVKGNTTVNSGGSATITAGSTIKVQAGSQVDISASEVNISGSVVNIDGDPVNINGTAFTND